MRVSVVVEVYRPVAREQRVPVRVLQRVRVAAVWTQNHEIRNIHHTNAESGEEFAKELGGGDDLEGDLHTNTDEDDVWPHTAVGRAELPGGRASNAVLR